MFKGEDDSSESENEQEHTPIIEKSLILDPLVSVDHLICSICFHVLWDPVVCGSPTGCHNAFCAECIARWLEKSNRLCPTCKKPFVQNGPPPILHSILNQLVIRCPNYPSGCELKLRYEELAQHPRTCPYKVQKCKGCKGRIIQKDYLSHISKCDQFIVECPRCRIKMTKAALEGHSRVECFSQEIRAVGERVTSIEHSIEEMEQSLDKLEALTSCFLSGEAVQMNIELYTTFNQHFIFPNPTLIKPSFNQQKEKFDFLHFYVLHPIYTESIASVKWAIKINKMIGNILVGFCSSMGVNSLDYVVNKYGELKRKDNHDSKYRLLRKTQDGFCFSCGDVLKFRYVGLGKSLRIWNETKRVGMALEAELADLGDKIYTFYSMDTLNDSISFL